MTLHRAYSSNSADPNKEPVPPQHPDELVAVDVAYVADIKKAKNGLTMVYSNRRYRYQYDSLKSEQSTTWIIRNQMNVRMQDVFQTYVEILIYTFMIFIRVYLHVRRIQEEHNYSWIMEEQKS